MFTITYATIEDKTYVLYYGNPMPEYEFEGKIKDKRCYILRYKDKPIGLMRFNLIFDFIPFLTLIYIDEPYRKMGFGSKAMSYWEDEMSQLGHKMIMTSTQVDENAQHFYRKLGYKDMGSIVMDIPPYEQPLEMFLGKKL
ncbi:MAG: GNAT family N-acetyltransferase [Defluviitaleaceae bacterium]|nr:GNAT family N-acetyltransferase [Defluviitaleaceae bacterium]